MEGFDVIAIGDKLRSLGAKAALGVPVGGGENTWRQAKLMGVDE